MRPKIATRRRGTLTARIANRRAGNSVVVERMMAACTEIHDLARKQGLIAAVPYSDYFHQSPRMGLTDMPPERFDAVREKAFSQVDAYNRSLLRKAQRFFLILTQNPKAAVEKLKNYFSK